MDRSEQVLERARRALAKELKIPAEQIRDDTDIEAELKLDSLDKLRLVFAIEDEFGITIPDESIPEDRRFRSVVEHLLAQSQTAEPG